MRTIIIGDIHGCIRSFETLLAKLNPDEEKDRLILLGDLFDRGPDSWEVWQKAMELEQRFGDRFVLLRGNHEDLWLQEHPTFLVRMMHSRVGSIATEQSFRKHHAKVSDSFPWLKEHMSLFYREESFQCVHAGVLVEPIEANDTDTLVHNHETVLNNLYAGKLTITGHISLQEVHWFPGKGEEVQILKPNVYYPIPSRGVVCIDTGCGKGGALTGMILENGRLLMKTAAENEQ